MRETFELTKDDSQALTTAATIGRERDDDGGWLPMTADSIEACRSVWAVLGKKLGFDISTVKPDESNPRKFTAATSPGYRHFQPYMVSNVEQNNITETYVSSPPALYLIDEHAVVWTLGTYLSGLPVSGGEFVFDVLRNGERTGEVASRIEKRNGRMSIFGTNGFKRWTGNSFI